jgi:hypothetical protein
VRDTAALYRLSVAQANETIEEVRSTLRGWRSAAREFSIPKDEIESMAAAFEDQP